MSIIKIGLEKLVSRFNQANNKDTSLLTVKNFDELIANHQLILDDIYQNTCASQAMWQCFYLPVIKNLTLFLQDLPASDNHHHSHLGGFLDHALDVINIAIKKRNALMLPRGSSVEEQNNKKDIWTYAIFIAAAMHDIGKINGDTVVDLYDAKQKKLGRWNPWHGHMNSINEMGYYRYQYNSNRHYKDHTLIAATMLIKLVPINSLDYLYLERGLFNLVLLTINGRYAESGDVGDIIQASDSESAAKSFVQPQGNNTHHSASVSLADKMLAAIRYVVLEKKQTKAINEPGAIGFTTKEYIYLLSKRVLDEAREELGKHNQSGVPFNNSRLMDELLDFKLIDARTDNKAIFNISIAGGGFQSKKNLTVLRIPLSRFYLNPSKAPKPFSGTLKEEKEKVEVRQTNSQNPTPEIDIATDNEQVIDPSDLDGLGLGFESDTPHTDTKTPEDTNTHTTTETDNLDDILDKADGRNCAMLFVKWFAQSLADGNIAINNQTAPVHILQQGLFLVSPVIFKLYNKVHWNKVQNGITLLKIAKKTSYDKNIFKIMIKPEYYHDKVKPAHKISGYLIGNYQEKFSSYDITIPKLAINEKVMLVN